jgi:hypothetical protein
MKFLQKPFKNLIPIEEEGKEKQTNINNFGGV